MTDRPRAADDFEVIRARRAEIAVQEGRGCECCGSTVGVARGPRGCAYNYEGKIGDADDPNYANLCPPCWEEEREYWDEMWREYYGGRL